MVFAINIAENVQSRLRKGKPKVKMERLSSNDKYIQVKKVTKVSENLRNDVHIPCWIFSYAQCAFIVASLSLIFKFHAKPLL